MTDARKNLDRWEQCVLIVLGSFGASALFVYALIMGYPDTQYLWLADAFLHGRSDMSPAIVAIATAMDMVVRDGKYYWPLGPLPAILFMPLVALFGTIRQVQGAVQVALGGAAFWLSFRLARQEGFRRTDATWLSLACCVGSIVIGVLLIGMPWHLADLLTVVLMLAALVEWRGRDRPLVVGTCLGLVVAARPQAIVAAGFFFLHALFSVRSSRAAARRIALLAAPIVLVLGLLGAYNAARFGNPFTTGQSDHYLVPGLIADRRAHGVFDLGNIPENFTWYFLALPELTRGLPVVDPRGVSALLLSPVFLWLVLARRRTPAFIAAAIATVASLLMYLSYFGTGFRQFGPRYLTDVLPLWYMLLLVTFRERGFGRVPKAVIAASVIVNVVLFHLFALHHIFHLL